MTFFNPFQPEREFQVYKVINNVVETLQFFEWQIMTNFDGVTALTMGLDLKGLNQNLQAIAQLTILKHSKREKGIERGKRGKGRCRGRCKGRERERKSIYFVFGINHFSAIKLNWFLFKSQKRKKSFNEKINISEKTKRPARVVMKQKRWTNLNLGQIQFDKIFIFSIIIQNI